MAFLKSKTREKRLFALRKISATAPRLIIFFLQNSGIKNCFILLALNNNKYILEPIST
jgi:hypothetical protein